MADVQKPSLVDRDIDQAIAALKKGANLLKYGRRGKPKFCPFRLSSDSSALIWHYGKDERKIELRHVSRIIPGQRTPVFQRYPQPEKEYLSFSLICNTRSLDLICKDKDETEVWFIGLNAIIGRGSCKKQANESRKKYASSCSPKRVIQSWSFLAQDHGGTQQSDIGCQNSLGKALPDIVSIPSTASEPQMEPFTQFHIFQSDGVFENSNTGAETPRVNFPSLVCSSDQSSCDEDFDTVGDVFIWGEGIGDGVMGVGPIRVDMSSNRKSNALCPQVLEPPTILDACDIALGERYTVVVSKEGEVFSWGKEAGGWLGHGMESDVAHPKHIEALNGKNIKMASCGRYHTCVVSHSGDLYTWGDDPFNCGLLGHGSEASHWIPQKVGGPIEGLQVSFISCGPWHTAFFTSAGQLFTFGDGAYGALGHGDRSICSIPREVEALKGLRTVWVACGLLHTAAVVEVTPEANCAEAERALTGKLFTWGDGEKGQLGQPDCKSKLVPERIASLVDIDFSCVACGEDLTVALTTSGRVYTMGNTIHGQLGSSTEDGNCLFCVGDTIADSHVENIACGSHHVAVLTSKSEVYTWGKGANGQLGHGDNDDRQTPTLVSCLKDKQIKSIACGSNFTAVICLHKGVSRDDSVCADCHNPFNFIRPRHSCYNCGFVFCNACSAKKSFKASLAPRADKPYRVCDDCFVRLQKTAESSSICRISNVKSEVHTRNDESLEKESIVPCLQGIVSRFSSTESILADRNFSVNLKSEPKENRVFPFHSETIQRPSNSLKSATSLIRSWQSLLPLYVLDHKNTTRSPSPVKKSSPRSSPPRSRTPPANPEDLKSCSQNPNLEIKNLRAQVEKLTKKSQHLEAELRRKSKQMEEATAQAADNAKKCISANEVIKTLTTKLKEMDEKMLDEQVSHNSSDADEKTTNGNSRPSSRGSAEHTDNPESESCKTSSTKWLPNGTKTRAHKSEWIVRYHPGVYITIASLRKGVNEIKRVRFSRRLFTEVQAEKWWADNGTNVCKRYNVGVA